MSIFKTSALPIFLVFFFYFLAVISAKPLEKAPQFVMPTLTFAKDALEPHMGKETVELHYGKHHAGYLTKFNALLKQLWDEYPSLRAKFFDDEHDIVDILRLKDQIPRPLRQAIINQGGGFLNHNIFWETMRAVPVERQSKSNPGPQKDTLLYQFITEGWDTFEGFENALQHVGEGVFGSGWAWVSALCYENPEDRTKENAGVNTILIEPTANQNLPEFGVPVVGVDVFEHAYYLDYKNNRSEFIKHWLQLVNWDKVNDNLLQACQSKHRTLQVPEVSDVDEPETRSRDEL